MPYSLTHAVHRVGEDAERTAGDLAGHKFSNLKRNEKSRKLACARFSSRLHKVENFLHKINIIVDAIDHFYAEGADVVDANVRFADLAEIDVQILAYSILVDRFREFEDFGRHLKGGRSLSIGNVGCSLDRAPDRRFRS